MSDLTVAPRWVVPTGLLRAARPQLAVMSGQLVAGLGNLMFAVVLARVLGADDYRQVVAFLAVYVLLHVPSVALSAAGALAPHQLVRLRGSVAAVGLAVGALTVVASGPIARVIGVSTGLVHALALAAPAAGLLGLYRGVAYGMERHARVTASLVAEPAVRLLGGVAAAGVAGSVGAAWATVLAGYVALYVCARPLGDDGAWAVATGDHASPTIGRSAATAFGMSFVLLSVLQSVDLLVANRVLDPTAAAQFGVLSTLGGAAFFATSTIPLVLVPADLRGRAHATSTAIAMTAVVGGSITVAGAIFARPFLQQAFGDRYTGAARLVGPYLLAMALLGLVRVLVARRGARGGRHHAVVATAAAIVVEAVGIARWATTVQAVVAITLATVSGLATVLALEHRMTAGRVVNLPAVQARATHGGVDRPRVSARSLWTLVGICVVAVCVRLPIPRGLWVDEAISVRQAQLPFLQMISDVSHTDVHPPLHHALLWATVRIFGTSEMAVRLPSLLAGVALVPAIAWVGGILFDRRTGLVAAALAAIAPFCVWYSQEARMYSLFMLLGAIAIGAQVRALRRGRTLDWSLYGLATAALLWTQYFAILPVAIQQAACLWVIWRDRRDPTRRSALVRGWALSALIVVVAVMPLLPILRAQLEAYGNRGAGLVPGQAGAGSSAIGGTISIYAVGANLIWAFLGYHADGVMMRIAALWPLLMLPALALLGRGRSRTSLLLFALVVVPIAALFVVGSVKRDLFELRYFSGAVPAMLLLAARFVTKTTVRRMAATAAVGVLGTVMVVGLVDQQINGANPRLYDFEGALDRIGERATDGDVILYEPSYLAEVVEYYAPDLDARPVGSPIPADGGVWVVATDRVANAEDMSAWLGAELDALEESRRIVDDFERPNVRVWELR